MALAMWKRNGFPGEVLFDGNMENNSDKTVLFVKASKDENEAKRIANFYKYNNYTTIFTDRTVEDVETAVAKPGTIDPDFYTLIIRIKLKTWNSRGGNTRKNNTRKNNTRKNYKKK